MRRFALPALCLVAALVVAHTTRADEKRFIENARQLTFDGKRAGEGYFSDDGKNLVFQSEREAGNPFFQIYVLSFETGDVHRVSPGTGKTTCAFFRPQTNRVLYASTHLDPEAEKKQIEEIEFRASGKERRYSWDYDEHFDIFSSDRDGKGVTRLTSTSGYDAEGAYSPDGSKIVFCSMRDAYPPEKLSDEKRNLLDADPSWFGEIYIMDADGSNATRLTDWPGYDGGPFFTPDGERIVWRHFTEDGTMADVYTMRLDGSGRKRLTDFGSMCWAPYFHPSGRYVIFTSNKLGFANFELYMVDADGEKEPVRVTFTDGFDGLPVFSPDGGRLAWTSRRGGEGRSQIFIGNWRHEAAIEALDAAARRGEAHPDDGDKEGATRLSPPAREALAGYSRVEVRSQFSPEIALEDLRAMVHYLASDELEGRMTGSEGERKAAEYIAARFQEAGVEPLGEDQGYFQGFPFTSGVKLEEDGCLLEVNDSTGTRSFDLEKDFRPLAFSENAEVEGEVVFVGYGLTMPGENEEGYDSYSGIDVTDKIVLALRYAPEDVDTDRRVELNRYAGLRYKSMLARDNGAKALLIAIGPNSPNAGELAPLSFDQAIAGSGLPVAAISGEVADLLFAGSGKTLGDVQSGLDLENPHVEGAFELPGVRVQLGTALRREKATGRNVLGYIPPGVDTDDAPVVVIGAHYDHLGHGTTASLAPKEEEGMIHNGADDNASGVAVVLELAAALAHERAQHPDEFRAGVVLAAWSGEEIGIIGSSYFAEHPTLDRERLVACLNFDMVGRLDENVLVLQGTGSSDAWSRMIERRNVVAGFNLKLQSDPFQPTDITAFYPKGIPVMSFFTGSHEDYHRPGDDAEKINYEGVERIARFARMLAMDLVTSEEPPAYAKVERSSKEMGSRASLRAYLGTIPDYATSDIEGVKLTGVRAGGPADKGGVMGGDIVVEFAGRTVKNIYDYTYALGAVKIGEPVEMVVLRDGERVTLTLVPEARK